MDLALQLFGVLAGAGLIVVGAETFAEHLSAASARLGITAFALAILLAGAEPEELATTVTASLRQAPGIAYGDVIGANVAMCLVALGLAAALTPLPFGGSARRYALLGLPLGVVAAALAWDGEMSRWEGALLVALYGAYVASIWLGERRPPALGEAGELDEARGRQRESGGRRSRLGRELVLVLVGVAATVLGAALLVDAVQAITHVETSQTRLGLTLVGFATAFELVVLAWSSARRGISEAVVAGVVGSFAYNATMSLGAGALARPLRLSAGDQLHGPWVVMVGSLLAVVALAIPGRRLSRPVGCSLLAGYPAVVWLLLS